MKTAKTARNRRRTFTPTKYGDGGAIFAAPSDSDSESPAQSTADYLESGPTNRDVYLCAFPPEDHPQARELTVETRDNWDGAHGVYHPFLDDRDRGRMLVPAGALSKDDGVIRRRYPRSQMNGRGVAFDSQYDQSYAREQWMRELGVRGFEVRPTLVELIVAQHAEASKVNKYPSDLTRRSRECAYVPAVDRVVSELQIAELEESTDCSNETEGIKLKSAEDVMIDYEKGVYDPDEGDSRDCNDPADDQADV